MHHEAADRSLAAGDAAFATCPLTELALLRFLVREGTPAAHAAAHPDVAELIDAR